MSSSNMKRAGERINLRYPFIASASRIKSRVVEQAGSNEKASRSKELDYEGEQRSNSNQTNDNPYIIHRNSRTQHSQKHLNDNAISGFSKSSASEPQPEPQPQPTEEKSIEALTIDTQILQATNLNQPQRSKIDQNARSARLHIVKRHKLDDEALGDTGFLRENGSRLDEMGARYNGIILRAENAKEDNLDGQMRKIFSACRNKEMEKTSRQCITSAKSLREYYLTLHVF